ncbi:fused MFS/spermidine synthase [Ilumatobacter sp.]|uniref:fused MFS/spermidine synthase n=1 Tax=Ilumatobacter sp. TaxID=1967498 RepID=UPI003B52640A
MIEQDRADGRGATSGAATPRPLPAWLAIALVTSTSAAVLVLEILAGRLLAPYVGVSLETFTVIIGTILAGIAFGAWAGGVAADHVDPRRLIPILLVVGGALAIATIPIVRVLGSGSGTGAGPRILVLTAFGFLPSATVLSAVPPAVVKLQLLDLATTGSTVGRLSAWGTAGALFGTFFTGYVLVAAAAVTTLIVTVGILLVASGLVLWATTRAGARGRGRDGVADPDGGAPDATSEPRELLAATGLAVVALLGAVGIDSPCEVQTAYYCAAVLQDPENESGRTLLLDDLRHSYVDLDDPAVLEFWYIRRLVDAIDVAVDGADTPIDALYLGGGAFTVPRQVRATRPGSDQTILEIDGDLVDLVEERIDFERGDDVEIVVGDGRLAMDDRSDDSADVVIGDAFGSRAVPFHLATEEFLREIDRVLRPDGVYAANVIDGSAEAFLRAEAATAAAVFDHVVVVRGPGIVAGRSGNSVIVASPSPIDVGALERRLVADVDPSDDPGEADGRTTAERVGEIVAGPDLEPYLGGAEVITDDHAPVDQLIARSR